VVNFVPGVVVTVILARHLGSSGYGQWVTVLAVMQMVAFVGDFGFEQVALSRAATEPERMADWLGSVLALRLAICIPLTIVCAALEVVVASGSSMALAGVLVSGTLLFGAASVGRLVFQLRLRNDLTVLTVTLNSVLWTGAVVAVAVTHSSITGFAAAFFLVSGLISAFQLALAWRVIPFDVRGAQRLWGQLLKAGLPLGLAGAFVVAYERLDQLLVFVFVGPRGAGNYGAAYRVLDASHFIPAAITTTAFPILAAAYVTDLGRARRMLQTTYDYLLALTLPVFAVTLVAGGQILRLLFGGQFTSAASALPILMLALVVNAIGYPAGALIPTLRLERQLIVYAGLGLAVNVVANCVFIPIYGFIAAAWVTLATEILVSGLATRRVLSILGLRFEYRRVARVVLASAITGGGMYLLKQASVPLGGLLVAAVAGYSVLAIVLHAIDVSDIRLMVARR
jgi:O-antigen/teichoic acid export membrane protein